MNKLIDDKFLLANKYFHKNQIDLAVKECQDILNDEPDYIQALNLMALIGLKSENYDLADSYFKKCLNIDNKNILVIKNYCVSLKKQQKLKDANKFLLRLYELTNASPDVTFELANNLLLTNNKEYALDIVKNALKNNTDSDLLNATMGNVLHELKQFEESEKYYKKAYLTNKDNFQILFRLGYYSLNNKKYHQSIDYFERIVKNIEKFQNFSQLHHLVYYNIGLSYENLSEFDQAEKYYLTAYELNQNDTNTLVNLSSVYNEKGEFSKAIELINKAISLNPENRTLYSNLGKIYYKMGDHRKYLYYNRLGNGVVILETDAESGLFKISD
tara:strand:+ start:5930 stop:6919 length:990 start_codon:yes stop_codon:yes gene_type:complete